MCIMILLFCATPPVIGRRRGRGEWGEKERKEMRTRERGRKGRGGERERLWRDVNEREREGTIRRKRVKMSKVPRKEGEGDKGMGKKHGSMYSKCKLMTPLYEVSLEASSSS